MIVSTKMVCMGWRSIVLGRVVKKREKCPKHAY